MIATYADNRLEAAARAAGLPMSEPEPRNRRRYVYAPENGPPKIPEPLPPTWAPGPNAKRLLDLRASECRFPVGDDSGVLQLFCGNEAHSQADPPYCPECARRILPISAKDRAINPKVLH